jgi:urease accessory protein
MVAGDNIEIEIKVDTGAICFFGSQASNKVYRNPQGLSCTHRLSASVAERALFVLAPDPVQCFAEASYEQKQSFHLAEGANLVLVDWLSAGRLSRGERWSFNRYVSRNEVFRGERRALLDAIDLDARTVSLTNRFGVGRFNCFATAVILGPMVNPFAQELVSRIASEPITPGPSLLVSASPISDGALLRVAGMSIEEVGHALYKNLRFISTLLKDDPWLRKW